MPNTLREQVGERITVLREARGLSQRDLSDELAKLGLVVRRETITQWENGTRDLKTEYLTKLSEFFGVSADWLLGLTDAPERTPAAVDELGLSPDAVSYLRGLTVLRRDSSVSEAEKRYFPISVLSAMLESRDFESVLSWCAEYIRLVNTPCSLLYSTTEEYKKLSAVLGQHGYVVTAPDRLAMCLFSERITNTLEKLLEDISFNIPEMEEDKLTIDEDYVKERFQETIHAEDLDRYIL